MAEDHETSQARQLPRAWTIGHRERVTEEQAVQRVHSKTVQNKMKCLLGHDEEAQVPQWIQRDQYMSKNLDETVCLQSKSRVDLRAKRGKRDYQGVQKAGAAHSV